MASSSRSKGSGSYPATVLPISTYSPAKQNIGSKASFGGTSSFTQNSGSAGSVFQTSRAVSSTPAGGMLFAGGSSSSASGRTSGNNSGASSYGFVALASDVSSVNSNPSSAPAVDLSGATDPGGDPNGPPIPVSDGWIFLIMMAMGYAGYRNLKLRISEKKI